MKEGHLQVANAVADMLARAKNDDPEAAKIRLKREQEAKDERLKAVIASAKADPKATLAFKVSCADELHTAWYRDSFLAKLLNSEQIDAVSTKVLIWCNTITQGITVPDEPHLLTELFVDMQNAVMYSDACLLEELSKIVETKEILPTMFADVLVSELDKNCYRYALINSGTWSHLLSNPKIHHNFDPVSKHELLLTGMLGLYGPQTNVIFNGPAKNEAESKKCVVYTDAFRHPQARSFKYSSPSDVFLFKTGLKYDGDITFEQEDNITYGGTDNPIKGLKLVVKLDEYVMTSVYNCAIRVKEFSNAT